MIDFSSELIFKTTRSSGPGGQNVNKVETAVSVSWEISESIFFKIAEKERIYKKLKNKINSEGKLQVSASEKRTQIQNKKIAIDKILELVHEAVKVPKQRLKTKPSRAKIEKRLKDKKIRSEVKARRRSDGD